MPCWDEVTLKRLVKTHSVKLTKSQLGPETPIIECVVSFAILSRFV